MFPLTGLQPYKHLSILTGREQPYSSRLATSNPLPAPLPER